MSKRHFDMICQRHLPLIADRIIGLSLSEHEETPKQINLFYSYLLSFNKFIQLRSLSINGVRSYKILVKITDECHHLYNLTHLNFFNCSLEDNQADFQLLVNNIWSFSKLVHCNFSIDIKGKKFFLMPKTISSSLERLSIYGSILKLNEINRLFEYTNRLKNLSINVEFDDDNNNYILSLFPTLIELHISCSHQLDISKMISLLQNTPNLRRLNVSLWSNFIDGYQWKQIIRNYLPELKIFRLGMEETLSFDQNIEERVDELINSFRSSFWIDEHQWFVRCIIQKKTIHLYTTSKIFCNYDSVLFGSIRSTDPQDNQQKFYNNMTSIVNETFFDQPIPSYIRLPNIEYLWIKLPINDQFWSIVPSLNRLNSLTVVSYIDTFQPQLKTLLNRAPCLRRLCITQDAPLHLQMLLFRHINPSVRQLDLRDYNHYFNKEECIRLSHSSLGRQCEVLSIMINNRESIIYFIKKMINLRSLNVRCEDEKYYKGLALAKNGNNKYPDEKIQNKDDLIQWLKDHLPSTCLIVRNPHWINYILIWI
ncbi:unnamed protein product [Rotaria sordida]|uniref:Uncharacterized protein n=1 Tax=Rotaria sordida TaxID=392033 RepID=A0A814RN87_9BILA|nr:unnamed protein product [Rotaria sordida]